MTQRFPYEDPRNDAAREDYDRTRNHILLETLGKARQGTLATSWRDDLRPPEYGMPADRIYTDADLLAIEEIRHMDLAAWEPSEAASWRHALDAWIRLPRRPDREPREHRPQLWPHSADSDTDLHDHVPG